METRHHHPHLDPRSPRDGDRSSVNPPVFVWKPDEPVGRYTLQVALDESFKQCVLEITDLEDSLFLPESALPPGTYYWRWASKVGTSLAWRFSVDEQSLFAEVPSAESWLSSMNTAHPRLYIADSDTNRLASIYRSGAYQPAIDVVKKAKAILGEAHEMVEPEYLPDREVDYDAFIEAFQRIMWESRAFALDATHLALAWLLSGDRAYGRAACRRFVSMSHWDPDGSSSIQANDEAHMSIIWHGAAGIDWVWSLFTDDERALVSDHLRIRAENTFIHMHDKGTYGITRFDSHAGREIVFLAWTLLAFHDVIPNAAAMLDWLRPVLCGLWPVWSDDDGAWAEGISYSLAYVSIMAEFAYILKASTGVDLFSRPFWKNHADWRETCMPSYAEWIGFGDHSEAWQQTWLRAADLVELIDRENNVSTHAAYVASLRTQAATLPARKNVTAYIVSLSRFFSGVRTDFESTDATVEKTMEAQPHGNNVLRVFTDTGWAAFRSSPEVSDEDIALLFRSSPYGAISHSHANNNDFVLHVAGRVLLNPSGFYCGYGSPHHATWVWHTKSHNCATLSGASQLLRSYDSTGALHGAFEDESMAYLRGEAAPSYAQYADRYDRHVAYLKQVGVIVLVDVFRAKHHVQISYEWNAHSSYEFSWEESTRRFSIGDGSLTGEVGVDGWVLHDYVSYTDIRSGFDVDPLPTLSSSEWPTQYHFRYATGMLVSELVLPVLLVPKASALKDVSIDRSPGRATITSSDASVELTWNNDAVDILCGDRNWRIDEHGLADI